ncbi:hypothetical protein [Marinicrinis sediminis]|uniref:Peptidase C-terminal archaeal/bacterial domain-containing protein n=1 Tax=Marinicrinis sediminis TaxID=1652465 RepID=A0ABW5R961_9BACL
MINDQEITFGVNNINKASYEEFEKKIDELLIDVIAEYTDNDFIDNKKVLSIKESLKVKLISFEDKKEVIDKFDKSLIMKNEKYKKTKINKKERIDKINLLKKQKEKNKVKYKKEDSSIEIPFENYDPSIDELQEYKQKAKEQIKKKETTNTIKKSDSVSILSSYPQGGPSFTDEPCDSSSINPHCGDSQDRLKQKRRFNGVDVSYNWLPYWVSAVTYQVNNSTKKRVVNVKMMWDQTALNNLNIDSNEAIEMEALFYNYGDLSDVPGYGYAYMYTEGEGWSTNLPGGYLDTRDLDPDTEKSYAVGTTYTELMVPEKVYEFTIYGYPIPNYAEQITGGLWQVNIQRGYWFDSTNYWFRQIRGSGDEWYVFNEEYETTAKFKQYHRYNNLFWAPGGFQDYTETNYHDQFRYKESFNPLNTYNSNVYTGSIPSGGYEVYKMQLNTANQIRIKTSSSGSNYDTTLRLYNHNFEEIAYNDDANGSLYSEINQYLAKGDYYVVVEGYSGNQMQSYLSASIVPSIGYESINIGETKYIDIPQNGSKRYVFNANTTGSRDFTTGYWQTNADTYLYLYDSNDNLVASNDDYSGYYSKITHYISTNQTFYIEVRGYNNSAVKCTLTLQ